MADVFISYSKSHRHLTEQLARELEAKGLSVWWDTELLAGESFRQRIQDELKACKAAIVIWNPEAVGSDYVLSEAERARVARKLIQVRTADIEPHDLPPPFDTSHVPLIEDRRAIFGGLARLGLLTDYKLEPSAPSALYQGGGERRSGAGSGRVLVGMLLAAALLAAGFALYRTYAARPTAPPDLASDDLRRRATTTAEAFFKAINEGLQDSSVLAAELRLSRRGLMSKVDAVTELRKLAAAHTRVSCKGEPGSLSMKKAEQTPDGYRAILTAFCDLTDRAGKTTTEKFALELEAARIGRGDQITGLWQPDRMVLWQAR